MINKYLKLQFVSMLLLLLIFVSCNRNNDIDNFKETPAERLSKTNAELKDALTSSKDGWKIMYFTDNREFGGFTYLMSFTPEGKVKMVSDFDKASLVPETSDYEIQSSYAPALVFTTRNKIHQLSDSNNSPGRQEGAGYRGDFEFVFDRIDEKGDIYFRTARSNVGVVFTKAKAEDWNSLSKNFTTEESALKGPESPFFGALEIKEGDKIQSYSFSYNAKTRFITLTSANSQSPFNTKYGVGFKENSIILSPAVKVGNEELSELVYDSTNKAYIAKGKQGEVILKFVDKPVDPAQFGLGKEILEGKSLYIAYIKSSNDKDPNGTTANAINVTNNILNANKNPISRIYLKFNYPERGQLVNKIEYMFTNNQVISHYVDIVKGENNAVILKNKAWSSTPVLESLKTVDGYLLDPQGLLLKSESYRIEYSNSVVTLKAVSSLSTKKGAFGISTYVL